jgi:hypothetical protein
MQKREELRQKGQNRSQKDVSPEGEKYHFQKGRINIIFGSK